MSSTSTTLRFIKKHSIFSSLSFDHSHFEVVEKIVIVQNEGSPFVLVVWNRLYSGKINCSEWQKGAVLENQETEFFAVA